MLGTVEEDGDHKGSPPPSRHVELLFRGSSASGDVKVCKGLGFLGLGPKYPN